MSVLRTAFRSRFSIIQEKNNEKIFNIINNFGGERRRIGCVPAAGEHDAQQTAGREPDCCSVGEPVDQSDAFADGLAETGLIARQNNDAAEAGRSEDG
jgi:hypothetical protein